MSQSAMIWKRVLERHTELITALSDNSEVESCDELIGDDLFADFDPEFNVEDSEPAVNDDPSDDQGVDDPFADSNADFDTDFDVEDQAPAINDELNDALASVPVVDRAFKDSADLWLTQARTGLEHALSAMGIGFSEIFPTKRPLLIFGSRQLELTMPEYHRVEVKQKGWPCRLHSTERLTVSVAAGILASSVDGSSLSENPPYFEGETVAVEVPNPLLADPRWIVMWPVLDSLPERTREDSTTESAELHQWKRVRRVVWCVNREQIGRRDTLDWLAHFWQNTPIRIALFRAASFVDDEKDEAARSRVLSRIRRTLERFDGIKGYPWTVVGP